MSDPNRTMLAGLRVLDWTVGPWASRATSMLADYGAEVIWVEPTALDEAPELDAVARAVFARNKRSVLIDAGSAEGRRGLHELVASADVLVHDRSPAVLATAGLSPADVADAYPTLVCCSLSACGPGGPSDVERPGGVDGLPAYESIVHALVGTTGEQLGGREPPIYEGLPFAGTGMAYLAQIAVLAALHRRRRTGHDAQVETSLFDGALSFLSMLWGHADADDVAAPMAPGAQRLISRTLLCADDEFVAVHTGAGGAFGRLIEELGLADEVPVSAAGGDIGVALTEQQRLLLERAVPEIFATATRSEWVERLTRADVCAISTLRPTEVFDEPQVRHNGMVVTVDDVVLGPMEQVAAPMRFGSGDAPTPPARPAPVRGDTPLSSVVQTWPRRSATAASPVAQGGPLLAGLKVVDIGVWYASSFSSRLLADLGADVVKIEPYVGDQMRGMRRPFQSAHSRKRSFAADLKHPELPEVLRRLMQWADVIHHNMRPGAAERLGVGYEQARAANPNIIYLHAPGWGSSGPDRDRQSFAPLVSGYVGASYEVAGRFNPPTYPVGNEDPGAGMLGAMGILMALVRGGGTYLELPQVNAAMNQVAHIARRVGGEPLGAGALDPLQMGVGPYDRLYRTSDGWLAIAALSPREVRALHDVLGLAPDPDLEPDDLADRIAVLLAAEATSAWLQRLAAAGVPALRPIATNNNRAFHLDPAHRVTRRVSEVVEADGSGRRQIDSLIRVAGAPPPAYRSAPPLGGHSRELLAELGFGTSEIEHLVSIGAVRAAAAGAAGG